MCHDLGLNMIQNLVRFSNLVQLFFNFDVLQVAAASKLGQIDVVSQNNLNAIYARLVASSH